MQKTLRNEQRHKIENQQQNGKYKYTSSAVTSNINELNCLIKKLSALV